MKGLLAGVLVLGVAVGLLVYAQMTIRAQERGAVVPLPLDGQHGASREGIAEIGRGPAYTSVQDALQLPFSFPFREPTALADVCRHLQQALKAPVVLDRAALDRQDVRPDDTVELELEGVRLRTGLKLLLDQVGLTYQVVPEDNLLILTDSHGSTEPIDRLTSEVKSLHHDIHDLQDAVDDVRWALGLDENGEPSALMRKPTIIEEVPGEGKPEEEIELPPAGASGPKRARPGA